MSSRFLCHYKEAHVVCEVEGQINYMYQANNAIALVELLVKITSVTVSNYQYIIKLCAVKRLLGLNCDLKLQLCTFTYM